jgi:hypothetical protein
MDKPHVKGVGDNVVRDAEGNPISPQVMMAARKLDDLKRAAHEGIGEIKCGGRMPARSSLNESRPRD